MLFGLKFHTVNVGTDTHDDNWLTTDPGRLYVAKDGTLNNTQDYTACKSAYSSLPIRGVVRVLVELPATAEAKKPSKCPKLPSIQTSGSAVEVTVSVNRDRLKAVVSSELFSLVDFILTQYVTHQVLFLRVHLRFVFSFFQAGYRSYRPCRLPIELQRS